MKTKNFTIINMINTLNSFSEKKLPQKISYAITRNLMLLQKDYDCYSKSLNKLFDEYNTYFVKDESGNVMYNDFGVPIVDETKSTEFNKEIDSLLNIEIDVEIYTIPDNVFDYEDTSDRFDSLSAADIMRLQSVLCKNDNSNNDGKKGNEENGED